jgi:hypothetical protein
MSEIDDALNTPPAPDDTKRSFIQIPIRRLCESFAACIHRWRSSETQAQPMKHPAKRIAKQARFDWGSFSAFEDGSIEIEIAGVKQWFRNFSELECSLTSRGDRPSERRRRLGSSQ